MPPRQRVFRSIYGRAQATIKGYDAALEQHGRINYGGLSEYIVALRGADPRFVALCDFLWNLGHLDSLLLELFRFHNQQIIQLCTDVFCEQWCVSASDVRVFFENGSLAIDGWRLMDAVFGRGWMLGAKVDGGQYRGCLALRDRLIHGSSNVPVEQLESGCIFLCGAIAALGAWVDSKPKAYDGSSKKVSIGIYADKATDSCSANRQFDAKVEGQGLSRNRWEELKAEILKFEK